MPYPNFPNKHAARPLVTPQRFLDYVRSRGDLDESLVPRGVLLVYRRSLMRSLVERYAARQTVRMGNYSLFDLSSTNVGLVGDFGIGGPMVSIVLEELTALGVRYFFSLGLAGGLQADGRIGDIVLCTSAIRDDGVSHHYLPPDAHARPSVPFTDMIGESLSRRSASFRRGATWTIDTPYRETIDEVQHYRAAGVLTVEMEAAALFAVASVRGVEAASAFVVSDLLGETEWTPDFAAELLNSRLAVVAEAGIDAIGSIADQAPD